MARAEARYTLRAEDRTRDGLRSAESRLQRFGRTVALGASRLAVPFTAAAGAIGGLVAGLRRIVTGLDDAAKAAKDFGISVVELEELRTAAGLLGTDLDTLLRITERLSQATDGAADGVKSYRDAFRELNLDASRFAQLGPQAQIAALDEALQGVSPSRQRALRGQLAGRRTGRVFSGGAREALQLARDTIDPAQLNEAAAAAERFNDALALLRTTFGTSLSANIGQPVAMAAGSDPVVGAIRDLADIFARNSVRTQTFRLDDASIDAIRGATAPRYQR